MKALRVLACLVLAATTLATAVLATPDPLADDWANPPRDARLRAYWWWLNGNVTPASITRDLEEMKAKGFGGALICDADGSSQDGNERAPHGPDFFSPAWRELYQHTLREADRLGLEMSLNIQSGWNLGGPMVTADDAPKKLVWTERLVSGPTNFTEKLAAPKARDGYYRDLFVLAYPVKTSAAGAAKRRPLRNWEQKALLKPLTPFSAPDSTPLLVEFPAELGEADTQAADVRDLTARLEADGTLRWEVPAGSWEILRFGCTLNDHCRVSTCSQGWDGYAIDPFDAGAFRRYWNAVVEPLIADAGPLAGKALKYLHTDSWEVEVANWTPSLREEFRQRRGYDLLPWLPVIAGRIVNDREQSNRFLHDFRRTMGDLAIDHHYRLFKEGAHRHGLLIHPESGGPHAVPIDAEQCLGFDDAPMSEFWAWSWRHRIGDENRFFVKQPASAAHTYGHRLVLAEGFTTIGPHWQERLWDNLKPAFDHACTEGLNLLVWHAFVCSPGSMGVPGQQYFAGTHLNPNVTWWAKSGPFFDYLNRCQAMLQRGRFVADVAYYYGDQVPNFAQLRRSDPARAGSGYDYDVVTEEVILTRMAVKDGRITLPDGMSYRVLALPERTKISLPVLRKLRELVAAGATVLGPRPTQATTLQNYPACDVEVAKLAKELWGSANSRDTLDPTGGESRGEEAMRAASAGSHRFGEGRVIWGKTAREVLLADGVPPDFEITGETDQTLDYIHRRDGDADIYFVANRTNQATFATCAFRIAGKAPELWNPVTGQRRFAAAYQQSDGRTFVPLDFPPCGSWFVVFHEPAAAHPASSPSDKLTTANSPTFAPLAKIDGPWTVRFDPNWGGPAQAEFPRLVSWTDRPEPGIRFYSGTATYSTAFDLPAGIKPSPGSVFLNLGDVRELAAVRLNGQPCGIVWAPPFRVNVTGALKPGPNELEVDVVNFWPNRIIGDAALPAEQRLTRTNIRKLTPDTPLMVSGLLGPVTLEAAR